MPFSRIRNRCRRWHEDCPIWKALIMRRLISFIWLSIALALAAAPADDLTDKERGAAKRLYELKCVKCHRPYEPKDYSQEEWRLWMTRMSKKARLRPSQEKLLNRYLDARRAEKPRPTVGNHTSTTAGNQTPSSNAH
jgi:hypothetical protein